MSIEHWKQINGTYYHVSDLGRVASARVGFRIMRIQLRADGRQGIKLFVNEVPHQFMVAQLVAKAFVGPQPSPAHFVTHKDGDKTNNRAGNLRWATPLETARHNIDVLHRQTGVKGEAHWNAKLCISDVLEIRRRLSTGEMGKDIAASLGISYKDVSRIKTGARWAHVP